MYAVVKYNDSRKEQSFEIIIATSNVEYAKKVAFQNAKKDIPKCTDGSIYRITTETENEYVRPINRTIMSYRIIIVEKYKCGFRILSQFSSIYAVIEIKKDIENIEEIDPSIICDKYYNVYDDEDESDE